MKWQAKFLKNAIFGILPLSTQEKLRSIKRELFPYPIQIDLLTLKQGLQQVEMLKASGCDPSGKDYLELGTGWSPVIPLVFDLAGCKSLALVDSQCLMDAHTFAETCRNLIAHKQEISERLKIEIRNIEERLNQLSIMPFDSALREMNCRYLAPYDLLNNDLPDCTLDIVTSRAVLEHVPPQTVNAMFREFYRLLRHNGAVHHIIDNSDHWEHNDKSISRLNFLKFSEKAFDIISSMNPLDYQNRLRHSQYRKMIESAGFRIVFDKSPPDRKALEDLKTLKIHSSFVQFSKEDLATLTSYIVAAK